jgi:hypothetical protein
LNPFKRKRQATFSATALAVYLSLNIEIVDDQRGIDCMALPLLSLTRLLMAGWWIQIRWKKVQRRYAHLQKKWQLFWSVAGIGWRSVAWGIGL